MTYDEKVRALIIISKSLTYEGGYSNNIKDKGKETYCGISRKSHPEWEGWKKIDAIKKKRKIKYNEIINDPKLTDEVMNFYLKEYFSKVIGKLPVVEYEPIICLLNDFAIHSGPRTAIKKLQMVINNLNGKDVIEEDGVQGPATSKAIMALEQNTLLAHYLEIRRKYLQAVAQQGSNLVFWQGWLNRLEKLAREYKIEKLTNW